MRPGGESILDATAYHPETQQEANRYYSKSKRIYGSLVLIDEAMVRRGDRVMKKYLYITDSDKRAKIKFDDLLTDDVWLPTTSNPDEIKYLEKMRQTINKKGFGFAFLKSSLAIRVIFPDGALIRKGLKYVCRSDPWVRSSRR